MNKEAPGPNFAHFWVRKREISRFWRQAQDLYHQSSGETRIRREGCLESHGLAPPRARFATKRNGTTPAPEFGHFGVPFGETVFVFKFLLFVFITRVHMKMYLMAARPWICIFRRAKEAANVRWLHVT